MNYSKGISWFDDCRIPFVDEGEHILKYSGYSQGTYNTNGKGLFYGNKATCNPQGRFPSNLLVSDDMLNDGTITKQIKWNKTHNDSVGGVFGGGNMNSNNSYGDKGTNSRYYDIDLWFNNLINNIY